MNTEVKKLEEPEDRYYLIYGMFFLQGTTVLLAFNLFMKNVLFPAVFLSSSFAATYSTWLTWALMLTTVLSSLVLTLMPPNSKFKVDPCRLIQASWVVYGAVFFVCAMLPFTLAGGMSSDGYFYITMLLALVVGAFSGALQNSLYALAANLPPVTFQAISFGQGFSGLSTTLYLMAYRGMYPGNFEASELVVSTFGVFLFGFLMIIASGVTFTMFLRTPYYRFFKAQQERQEQEANRKPSLSDLPAPAQQKEEDTVDQLRDIFMSSPSRYYPIGIWFVFAVTFSVFPAFIILTQSAIEDASEAYRAMFLPLGFLAFDLSDSIGKFLPGLPVFFIRSHRITLISNLFRIIFIALFMWFNFIPTLNGVPFYPYATRWIRSDAAFFLIIFAFGLSNGYFGSLLLMKAADSLPVDKSSPKLREKMGKMMGLFLGFGLITGPCVAFVLQATLG